MPVEYSLALPPADFAVEEKYTDKKLSVDRVDNLVLFSFYDDASCRLAGNVSGLAQLPKAS